MCVTQQVHTEMGYACKTHTGISRLSMKNHELSQPLHSALTQKPLAINLSLSVKMLVTQLCPTLRPHGLYSPPGPSVYGILQARILEWVAILFSRGSSQVRD